MKRMITRLLSLLLILAVLCPAGLAEGGQEAPEIIESFATSVRNIFVREGTLYAQTFDDEFFRQVEGGWQSVGMVTEDLDIWNIYTEADTVWLLVRREAFGKTEACYQIVPANFDENGSYVGLGDPVTIGWELGDDNWLSMYGLVVNGDTAYVLSQIPNNWDDQRLYRVDMATGEPTKILDGPITELTAYKDGLLLARRSNWEERDDNGDPLPPQIVAIDPATAEMTTVGLMIDWETAALAYDAETDSCYFCDSTHVYRATEGEPELVGYLLPSDMSRQNASSLVWQGRYYIEDHREVSSAPIDASLIPSHVLRVQQIWEIADLLREYARLHPEVAIEYVDCYWSDLDAFTRIMQGENAPVLFSMSMSHDFPVLRSKKYLVDMSSSQVLMDTVSAMYPHLTRDLLVDGQLYALPINVEVSCLGYYPIATEKAGIPEESMPSTYGELLDFIVTWHDDYFPDNEGMEVVEYADDLRRSLIRWIYDAQQLSCQNGETLTYNTPTIRALLNRIDEITPIIDIVAPKMDDTSDYEYIQNNAIITEYECFPLPKAYRSSPEWDAQPLVLALDEQTPPTIETYMTVLAVNPYTTETEAAIDLLEYIAQNQTQVFRTTMMPDCNDPIEINGYDRDLEYWTNEVAAVERRLAEDPDNPDLKDQLASYQRVLKNLEEGGRWAMTTEDIMRYRENIAPYLTLSTNAYSSSNASQQMYSVLSRYYDGQVTADEFIQEIDRIVWMVQMENQ